MPKTEFTSAEVARKAGKLMNQLRPLKGRVVIVDTFEMVVIDADELKSIVASALTQAQNKAAK